MDEHLKNGELFTELCGDINDLIRQETFKMIAMHKYLEAEYKLLNIFYDLYD